MEDLLSARFSGNKISPLWDWFTSFVIYLNSDLQDYNNFYIENNTENGWDVFISKYQSLPSMRAFSFTMRRKTSSSDITHGGFGYKVNNAYGNFILQEAGVTALYKISGGNVVLVGKMITDSDLTPTTMTTTRTENPHVSATSFNRIVAKRIGPNLLWVLFNAWIDLTPLPNSDDIVEIGKVNGISGIPFGALHDIPAQNGSGTILLDFRDNGVFKIINQSGKPVSGFVRTTFVTVVNFA